MAKKKAPAATAATDYSTYFEGNPEAQHLLVTSDGEVFTDKNKSWAASHAKTLEDKTVTTIERDGDTAEDEDGEETEETN